MRTVLIDDESKSREVLTNLLEMFCPDLEIVGEADGVNSGIEIIQKCDPDLVFFDIMLKDGDSFEIIQALDTVHFDIIFITAFDEMAVKALTFGGVDCLLKPVDIQELESAVTQIKNNPRKSFEAYKVANGILKSQFTSIPIITNEGLVYENIEEIVSITPHPSGCQINLRDHTINSTKSVIEFQQLLPHELFVLKEKELVKK